MNKIYIDKDGMIGLINAPEEPLCSDYHIQLAKAKENVVYFKDQDGTFAVMFWNNPFKEDKQGLHDLPKGYSVKLKTDHPYEECKLECICTYADDYYAILNKLPIESSKEETDKEKNMEKTDNELIAEFMGGIKQVITDKKEYGYPLGKVIWHKLFDEEGYVTHLDYDTSWDWLMDVVEKIEAIEDKDGLCPFYIDIDGLECVIKDGRDNAAIAVEEGNSKIKAVNKAILEFIKWYNSNKEVN